MSEIGNKLGIKNKEGLKETSRRLKIAMGIGLRFILENPNKTPVVGEQHLKEIPQDKKVIIATTHLSDADVPIAAYAICDKFDIAIIHHSTHDNPSEDVWSWAGAVSAGRKNFLSVKSRKEKGKVKADFAPEDFEPMKKALEVGKAIVIAAHNPTYDWKLSRKGGLGAVYLAQISDAIILPISVNIESESKSGAIVDMRQEISRNKRKLKAQVFIGHPIVLDKINVQKIAEILRKRNGRKSLSPVEKREFSETNAKLRKQSETVMASLAAMLPPEKR